MTSLTQSPALALGSNLEKVSGYELVWQQRGPAHWDLSMTVFLNNERMAKRKVTNRHLSMGQGHVTVNKPVIFKIYIVAHTWRSCSVQIFVDGVNPHKSDFQKSTNISAIVQHMSVSFVSLRITRVHLQNNTFIFEKNSGNHCDMADQKYYQIVVAKEVCYTA